MARALKACTEARCPEGTTTGGRCSQHRRERDVRRGTATQRGYTSRGHLGFRSAVLDEDPICVLCKVRASTVADHWPVSRRDLLATGADPNDPRHGRGLCATCHARETAKHQPGGWQQDR